MSASTNAGARGLATTGPVSIVQRELAWQPEATPADSATKEATALVQPDPSKHPIDHDPSTRRTT